MIAKGNIIYIFMICTMISLLLFPSVIISQNTDTTQTVFNEFITEKLENLATSTDLNLDYSDLVDEYYYYTSNRINLNGDKISKLRDLLLINDIQLNNLRLYRQQYGDFYTIYELLSVTGFDEKTVKQIQPFIIASKTSESKTEIRNIAKYGKHELLLRTDRIIEKKAGFILPADSAINNPGTVYLGDPQHYYLRYSFNYNNKFRLGLTMDKDAGEVMFKGNINDSIKNLVGKKIGNGYDFLSAYAYAEDFGAIKKIVIGDYHLEFGQGITLWSGLSFGKSSDGVTMQKFGRGIRPNTSANENRYFRGAAMTVNWKKLTFTPFYSNNNIDGNIVPLVYNDQDGVTSIIETGMHRTINELIDKNTINIQVYGSNLSLSHKKLSAGITFSRTILDLPLVKPHYLYKYFNFEGENITNLGADFSYSLNQINFFGEISSSFNQSYAGLIGANTFLSERLFLTMVYHNYGSGYHNLYSNPIAEGSNIFNENGIYLGFKAFVISQISISGYIDHYSFPWLKYNIASPSVGRDYLFQIDYNPVMDFSLYFRYRYKNKQKNYKSDYSYMPEIVDVNRNELRLFLSYNPTEILTLNNRFDFVYSKEINSQIQNGYLFYQDIIIKPKKFSIDATLRYCLFSTDGYDSRIYTYENDVLYAFSIPSYFDKGQRWYIMLKWKATSWLSMWLRYARTTYFNKNTVGSGNDLIEGNKKSEFKVQLKFRF